MKCKRMISLILVIAVLTGSFSLQAVAAETATVSEEAAMISVVQPFFSYPATIYGKDGADITLAFHSACDDNYMARQYQSVYNYIMEYVGSAEATVSEERSNIAPYASRVGVRATRWYFQTELYDEVHGWENHNHIGYYVYMDSILNTNEGIVVSADLPIVYVPDGSYILYGGYWDDGSDGYDNDNDRLEYVSRSAVISADETMVTYSFEMTLSLFVADWGAEGPVGLAYRYRFYNQYQIFPEEEYYESLER